MSTLINSAVVADAYKNKEAIANSANFKEFIGTSGELLSSNSYWQNLALSKTQQETFWGRDLTELSVDQVMSSLGTNSIDNLVNSAELTQLKDAINSASKDDPMAGYGLMIAAEKTIEHLRSQPLEGTEFKTEQARTLATMQEIAVKIEKGEFQRYPAVNAEQLSSMNAMVQNALNNSSHKNNTNNAQQQNPIEIMQNFHTYATATSNKPLEKITELYIDNFQHFSQNPTKEHLASQLDQISGHITNSLVNSQENQSKIQHNQEYYPAPSQDQQAGLAA